jgi:transposase
MDRAGRHRSGRLKVPPNMGPAFLPPYSPEPDPQEQVWDELREKSLANRVFRDMDAVVDAAVEGLRRMEASPSMMAKLTWRSWM